ncbi:NuA4-domain-containing protein [Rickenella mellea]|uniref:Chromatin modification-related protein EAF6 n=1 Tax=Rickenella mellea TaxID=50990 RepID=A0A4Y7Q735_9AGAM|nr:NuA4-domain-containing protein [Rickenella mellea]
MASEPVPSAEDKAHYDASRKELIQALSKKRAVDKQLAQLEVQIFNFEGSYLADTTAHSGGNIIQGFDAYLKNQTGGRRKYEVSETDRVFSNSSVTYQKSLELMGDGEETPAEADALTLTLAGPHSLPAPSSNMNNAMKGAPGLTTVVLPPARTQELSAAQQKKARDKEYQRRKRASASMRSLSTVSAEDENDSTVLTRRPSKRTRMVDDD